MLEDGLHSQNTQHVLTGLQKFVVADRNADVNF
jgi:hypothetical protein